MDGVESRECSEKIVTKYMEKKKRMYGKIVNNHEGVKIFYEEGKNEDEGE